MAGVYIHLYPCLQFGVASSYLALKYVFLVKEKISEQSMKSIHVDIQLISWYSIYMQIATSIMYKGFLLLDPCDAETVDEYLRTENQHRMPGKGTPRSFQPAYNKTNFEGPGFNSTSTYIPNNNYRVPKLHLETWLGLDSVLSSTMKM